MESTIACFAGRITPEGRAAVAVVRVWGIDAAETILRLSGRGQNFAADRSWLPAQNSIVYREIVYDSGHVEDVVLLAIDDRSFEIHCHGGEMASRKLLDALKANGATLASDSCGIGFPFPVETRPPSKAEMAHWGLLCRAHTERSAAAILRLVQGQLAEELRELAGLLDAREYDLVSQRIDVLVASYAWGKHLIEPWKIAFVGPPNVGKSSLLNAIAGFQRAIVQDQPGTTRDVLQVQIAIAGWPVVLFDTAGLRETSDPIERAGIEKTLRAAQEVDLVLEVRAANFLVDLQQKSQGAQYQAQRLRVVNQIDLAPDSESDQGEIGTSALTGVGLPNLINKIAEALFPSERSLTQPFIAARGICDELQAARSSLARGDIEAARKTIADLNQ